MMGYYYCDSSALAKRYLTETGSAQVGDLMNPEHGHVILASEVTRVEIAAAFASRARAQRITVSERDELVRLFLYHCDTEYSLIAVAASVVSRAVSLTQQHRLRGYDAIQLASALTVAGVVPGLTFVAADDDLTEAATVEGLPVLNPNL